MTQIDETVRMNIREHLSTFGFMGYQPVQLRTLLWKQGLFVWRLTTHQPLWVISVRRY